MIECIRGDRFESGRRVGGQAQGSQAALSHAIIGRLMPVLVLLTFLIRLALLASLIVGAAPPPPPSAGETSRVEPPLTLAVQMEKFDVEHGIHPLKITGTSNISRIFTFSISKKARVVR